MENKGFGDAAIVTILIVIVFGALAGVYMLKGEDFGSILGEEGGENESTSWGGAGEGIVWDDVSSLDMKKEESYQNAILAKGGRIMMKDLGTSDMKMRYEFASGEIYIINGEIEKAWIYFQENWRRVDNLSTTSYESMLQQAKNISTDIENNFSDWSEGENITIQNPNGTTTRFYDIEFNPDLEDSLFETPAA